MTKKSSKISIKKTTAKSLSLKIIKLAIHKRPFTDFVNGPWFSLIDATELARLDFSVYEIIKPTNPFHFCAPSNLLCR